MPTQDQAAYQATQHLLREHGVRRVGSLNASDIGKYFEMNRWSESAIWQPPKPPEKILMITHTALKSNITTVHDRGTRSTNLVWPRRVCRVTG